MSSFAFAAAPVSSAGSSFTTKTHRTLDLCRAPASFAPAPAARSYRRRFSVTCAQPTAATAAVTATPQQRSLSRLLAFVAQPTLRGGILASATVLAAVVLARWVKTVFDTPARPYRPKAPDAPGVSSVGDEYDEWTNEGILEHYWGEHVHLGYYSEEERKRGSWLKNFKKAKVDFVDEMLKWTEVGANSSRSVHVRKILDVGCGIGGTSRILAAKFPNATVTGITLSAEQARRASELAKEQGLDNVEFVVMDALNMTFNDDTFDLVWACESGEHMPDKLAYVNEMTRVLGPKGRLAIATWCQRETPPEFTQEDLKNLQFLYDEWAHPHFISYQEYGRLMLQTGQLNTIVGNDWTDCTISSWLHSVWVGVVSPWIVIWKGLRPGGPGPRIWYKVVREIVTLVRMHNAFDRGLMQYGMIQGTKTDLKEEPSTT